MRIFSLNILKMKCDYCNNQMYDFTESYECCHNDNCPYFKLPTEEKKEGFPRRFFKNKLEDKNGNKI